MSEPYTAMAVPSHLPLARRAALSSALWLGGAALVALAPFVLEDYSVFQLTLVMATAIALLGLNLLTGFNGPISLGHGAFFALGAYTQAILMDKLGLSYTLGVPLAGLLCLGFGVLFGLPALRLDGLYLALATFALAVSLPQLLKYRHLAPWTGGVQGITLSKPAAPFGLALTPDQWLYFFTLFWLLLAFLSARRLLRSHVGRALVAIRDQPIAALALGVDVPRYKTLTFGVSALYTGIAGALSTIAVQFVAPDSFSVLLSIDLLVGIVVGGIASLSGALYGAMFLRFVPMLTDQLSKTATGAVYGVVLIGFVYALPLGIAGFVTRITARLRATVARRGHD
ncbi:MAG: branched-chain amino acid transporter permease [Myxococcaceae bacterium]|nr:branched-chain amino acid transporter permease [Myxococcaceae bacterium]